MTVFRPQSHQGTCNWKRFQYDCRLHLFQGICVNTFSCD